MRKYTTEIYGHSVTLKCSDDNGELCFSKAEGLPSYVVVDASDAANVLHFIHTAKGRYIKTLSASESNNDYWSWWKVEEMIRLLKKIKSRAKSDAPITESQE